MECALEASPDSDRGQQDIDAALDDPALELDGPYSQDEAMWMRRHKDLWFEATCDLCDIDEEYELCLQATEVIILTMCHYCAEELFFIYFYISYFIFICCL